MTTLTKILLASLPCLFPVGCHHKRYEFKGKGLLLICVMGLLSGCAKDPGADPSRRPDATYEPNLDASLFPRPGQLLNKYFMQPPGSVYVYTGHGEEGEEYLEVVFTVDTTSILNIPCLIVLEDVYSEGGLIEREEAYFAEDLVGNVWALGASVLNFSSSGAELNAHTSWLAGIDGAKPGIIMLADPQVGIQYRQEYYFNVSENQAEVVDTGVIVTTAMATFYHCIVIREWSELEPEIVEYKTYAPGIGLVKDLNPWTQHSIELIEIR